MYKDVCKKISAFMLTVCLIVTMVEWPTTVWAGQGTVNTYRNGDGVLAGAPCEAQAVAAVFTANRNADGADGEIAGCASQLGICNQAAHKCDSV